MGGYKKPKVRLHREFIYLNSDTVINSLSAFEAGKVDEIIEKVTEAREGGIEGSIGYSGAKLGGGKKRSANFEEELTRTRTNFSAFEEWHHHLDDKSAIGEFDSWDLETRNEVSVGDTIRFQGRIAIAPVQRILLAYLDFSKQAGDPDSALKQPIAKLAETKRIARQMNGWMTGPNGERSFLASVSPLGVDTPRVFARLDERYLVDGIGAVDGEVTVIAQVESLVAPSDAVPAIRVLRETPPTPKETETITNALQGFTDAAKILGVEITPGDITIEFPAVLIRPIAVFR